MAAKTFPVEASHILMFARSVGDPNRVYSDADYAKTTEAGGVIAPPTFNLLALKAMFVLLRLWNRRGVRCARLRRVR